MPEEERRTPIIDFLLERPELMDRPIRKRALKGIKFGVNGVLTMPLKPAIADSLAKFLAKPLQKGLKGAMGSTIGAKSEKLRKGGSKGEA